MGESHSSDLLHGKWRYRPRGWPTGTLPREWRVPALARTGAVSDTWNGNSPYHLINAAYERIELPTYVQKQTARTHWQASAAGSSTRACAIVQTRMRPVSTTPQPSSEQRPYWPPGASSHCQRIRRWIKAVDSQIISCSSAEPTALLPALCRQGNGLRITGLQAWHGRRRSSYGCAQRHVLHHINGIAVVITSIFAMVGITVVLTGEGLSERVSEHELSVMCSRTRAFSGERYKPSRSIEHITTQVFIETASIVYGIS